MAPRPKRSLRGRKGRARPSSSPARPPRSEPSADPPLRPEPAPFTGSTICRSCGRLGRQPVPREVVEALRSVAHEPPSGWVLPELSVSFLGFCPGCLRTGRAVAPR